MGKTSIILTFVIYLFFEGKREEKTPMDSTLFYGDIVESRRILYTPSHFARTNLIHLQEIGELTARCPHTSRREHLSSFLFFIILSGSGRLEYENAAYPLHAGDCVFLDCKKAYAHSTSEDLWTLMWVHFYGPNVKNIYEKYTERGGAPWFHAKNRQEYERLLDEIYHIAESAAYLRDMKITEKLTSLLVLLMEESWHPENRKEVAKKQNLQAVKEYLDQHYAQPISLDFLAERFYINKYYLTRIFKEQFGVSVNHYLLEVRITRAKQLLRFTDMTVEAVGAACGIEDANYFSRVFKKTEGISPGKFRKLW